MALTLTVGSGHGFTAGQTVYVEDIQWLCDEGEDVALTDDFINGELYLITDTDTTTITLSTVSGGTIINNDVEADFANDHSDITFNNDGTIAFVTGFQGGAGQEYQTKSYALSTAYDFSTAGAATATHEWGSGGSFWVSRMLWDDLGYRATIMEMRAGPTAGEMKQFHTGSTTVAVSAITNASPGVVTTGAPHGLTTGDVVYMQSVGGMTEVNRTFYKVDVLTTTTFELKDDVADTNIDTSAFGVYTSGGTVRKINPYDISDIDGTAETTKDITGDIDFDLTFNSQHWRWNDDGTKIFFLDTNSSKAGCHIREYALTTGYDLNSMSTTQVQEIDMPADGDAGESYFDFDFCDSGTTISWLLHENNNIDKYALSTAYDPSTMATIKTERFDDNEIVAVDPDDGPRCITYADGGNWMYVAWSLNSAGTEEKYLRQYSLDTSCTFPTFGDTCTYLGGGTVTTATTSVDELWHLEGEEVCVVVDGVVDCTYTVANGSVSGWDLAGRVHIGLPFITDIETLNITQNDGDASQHQTKSVSRVTLRFFKSLDNVQVGPDVNNLTPMEVNTLGTNDAAILIGDGDYEDREIYIQPVWNSNGRVHIRQTEPSPLTILAVIPEFEAQDDEQGRFG